MADNAFATSNKKINTGSLADLAQSTAKKVSTTAGATLINNGYNTAMGVLNGSSSGGNSSGGSSGSSKPISGSSSGADYGAYLNSLLAQRRAAAESAYNNAISRINDAYNSAASSFGNIYNRGVDTLNGSYNNSQNKINQQAQDSMQEAYVNKMRSMKNLSQQLAAMGMSGGASESATAGLINNYGNARNGIQKTWNTNLSDLEQTYNANLNDLYSAYQSQMANLANVKAQQLNQAEMNLANMISDSSGGLYQALLNISPTTLQNALSGAVANQNAYTPVATEATNVVNPVNTQQVNDMGEATQYAKYLASLQAGANNSYQAAQALVNAGLDNKTITDLINSQYYANR